jgi:hypothetical protein
VPVQQKVQQPHRSGHIEGTRHRERSIDNENQGDDNPQVRVKPRTMMQIAGLYLQPAGDYHQQYLYRGLVIVMQQYSRQHVVDDLNRLGYRELAEKALRDLPDPVGIDQLAEWCLQHGIPQDEVISRMGGSP